MNSYFPFKYSCRTQNAIRLHTHSHTYLLPYGFWISLIYYVCVYVVFKRTNERTNYDMVRWFKGAPHRLHQHINAQKHTRVCLRTSKWLGYHRCTRETGNAFIEMGKFRTAFSQNYYSLEMHWKSETYSYWIGARLFI